MTVTDRYPPGERVRVVLRGDPYDGHIGVVAFSQADCDEMLHTLVLPDGTRGRYLTAELLSLNAPPPLRRPPRPSHPPRPLVRRGPGPDLDRPPAAADADDENPEEN